MLMDNKDDDIWLSKGLEGQDNNLDILTNLFEKLQLATVETAHPTLDLITFSQNAFYFGVILKERRIAPTKWHSGLSGSQTDEAASTSASNLKRSVRELKRKLNTADEEQEKKKRYHAKSPIANAMPLNIMDMSKNFPAQSPRERPPSPMADSFVPFGAFITSDQQEEEETFQVQEEEHAEDVLGMIYLIHCKHQSDDPLHVGELKIGIILAPEHQGKGYARRAVELVLTIAFQDPGCHRVQAILPHHVAKDRAICLFTYMRFGHEGTRRRAFLSPMENEYKDVTYMGMIDTEWVLRDRYRARPAPKSVWDELFARHQREREELLNWESSMALRRTPSMATIRAITPEPTRTKILMSFDIDDEDSDVDGMRVSATNIDKGQRKDIFDSKEKYATPELPPESDSESDAEGYYSTSSSASSASWHRFETPDGYSSTASWDVVEPSAPPSSASIDSIESASMRDFINNN